MKPNYAAISDALVDGATLEREKYRRFEDLSEEEIKRMSLQSYNGYEKKEMEKNALQSGCRVVCYTAVFSVVTQRSTKSAV